MTPSRSQVFKGNELFISRSSVASLYWSGSRWIPGTLHISLPISYWEEIRQPGGILISPSWPYPMFWSALDWTVGLQNGATRGRGWNLYLGNGTSIIMTPIIASQWWHIVHNTRSGMAFPFWTKVSTLLVRVMSGEVGKICCWIIFQSSSRGMEIMNCTVTHKSSLHTVL